MRHWLAHKLGWNTGRVVMTPLTGGALWVAWRCDGCGRVEGGHVWTGHQK